MEKLIRFGRNMSSVTDMSLSESDTRNSGNIQAGFGWKWSPGNWEQSLGL